jgi:uncharacterized glyoxalase superfamily protein PhnB
MKQNHSSNKNNMTTNRNYPGQTAQPYLFFDGRCEEAIEFYRSALGAEVTMLMHFKDSPESNTCAREVGNKVLHASLRIGETTLMASVLDDYCPCGCTINPKLLFVLDLKVNRR